LRKRTVLTGLALAMTLQLVGAAGAAHAQVPTLNFTFTPTVVTQGDKVSFSGTGCPHKGAAGAADGVFLITPDGSSGHPVDFVANAAGEFSGQLDTTADAPGRYTTLVSCTSTGRSGPGSTLTINARVIPGSTYHPLTPARVLDTRDGTGVGGGANPLGADATIDVAVTGVGGVPATGVSAVVLNVTATQATDYSYITVWPAGAPRPLASNIDFYPGRSTPNLVKAKVGTGGKVSIYNISGSVHVLADVQGWYSNSAANGSSYVPLNPVRILDTRNGTGAPQAQLGPDGSIDLKVTDVGGVPASGVSAVVLNVTATNASSTESYMTVWPSGSSLPLASNLNVVSGEHVPNLVIARVGDGGKVSIFNKNGTVDVVADLQGYYAVPATPPPGSTYTAVSPVRILDSRDGTGVPGGFTGQLGTGATLDLAVGGVAGVPANATAVVLNFTVADSPGPASYLTVYPTGTARPLASNLNWQAGQTKALLVISRVANGKVTVYNNLGSTNVIADLQGWFTQG
jgi:hypothetical protein